MGCGVGGGGFDMTNRGEVVEGIEGKGEGFVEDVEKMDEE